jgi:hypothetical protein
MGVHEDTATKIVLQAQRLFYKKLTDGLSEDELTELNRRLKEEAYENALGEEVTSAVFNYICPQSGKLSAVGGFNAHGNVNTEGEIETIITVDCSSCGDEHPILVISFSKMLAMPFVDS